MDITGRMWAAYDRAILRLADRSADFFFGSPGSNPGRVGAARNGSVERSTGTDHSHAHLSTQVPASTTAGAPEPEPPDTVTPLTVSGDPAEPSELGYWERPPADVDQHGHDVHCKIDPTGITGHVCCTSYGNPTRPGQSCFLSARIESLWDAS